MTKLLNSTDAVIDALGGSSAVARLLGREKSNGVSNWRQSGRGKFPPETFLIFSAALKRKKLAAPPSLWGIEEPTRERASA